MRSDLVDWQFLSYKDNYSRLQRAKYEWDRNNLFNHRQSIELMPVPARGFRIAVSS